MSHDLNHWASFERRVSQDGGPVDAAEEAAVEEAAGEAGDDVGEHVRLRTHRAHTRPRLAALPPGPTTDKLNQAAQPQSIQSKCQS